MLAIRAENLTMRVLCSFFRLIPLIDAAYTTRDSQHIGIETDSDGEIHMRVLCGTQQVRLDGPANHTSIV